MVNFQDAPNPPLIMGLAHFALLTPSYFSYPNQNERDALRQECSTFIFHSFERTAKHGILLQT
jgi:hypothetical protein